MEILFCNTISKNIDLMLLEVNVNEGQIIDLSKQKGLNLEKILFASMYPADDSAVDSSYSVINLNGKIKFASKGKHWILVVFKERRN
ncbi:MAG: hypothetical protein JW703_00765 [Candidatus Diapherotrites archaeon]|nr:hypothetical protein [Candidatus Diapherotrites archaeon]